MNLFFPSTVFDGFFENPDAVVDFANQQEYSPAPDGRWPGVRSKELHEIHPELFDYLCMRMFGLFYDVRRERLDFAVSAMFQKVSKDFQDGWVHRDNGVCTGIVYLSKNASADSGTSLCRLKSGVATHVNPYEAVKKDAYLGNIAAEEARQARETNNSLFEETLLVKNVYNRMFLFDACQHHKANGFSETEERLTLVAFVNQLGAPWYPASRMRSL